MQMDAKHTPDYIFEASWEVCNKWAVSTPFYQRRQIHSKNYTKTRFFYRPDVLQPSDNPWSRKKRNFMPIGENFGTDKPEPRNTCGRWNVPGKPIVFLIKSDRFFETKEQHLFRDVA